jgi:hypothetical protein
MAWDEYKYIGKNTPDNGVDTSQVVDNPKGTVLERLEHIGASLSTIVVADFILSDTDDFDVPDADADTVRWNPEYLSGAEGGSADIDTTTADHLMVKVDPDATPAAARYSVSHNLPFYADFFTVTIDMNCTWGTITGGASAGIILSAGTTYDANNYLAIERQKATGVNRITVSGKLNGVAITPVDVAITDDAIALKISRYDDVWRFYYSLTQHPTEMWVLVAQVEDSSVYMTDQVTPYFEIYSAGSADAESIKADFGYFRYLIGSGGGGQYITGDYDSSWVGRNQDGNVMERQEDLREDLVGTNGVVAFPAAVDIANGVSMAAAIRAILTSLVGGDDYDAYTNISNTANTSINAIAQKFAALWAADGANIFNPTIQGSARTDLELALTALASYVVSAGGAWSAKVNNSGSPLTNLYDALNAFFAVIGIDGTNTWSTSVSGATQTTVEATEQAIGTAVEKLSSLTDGINNYPNSVVAGSILAKIISKVAAGATPSGFDNTTDSLEAISDKVTDVNTDLGNFSGQTNLQSLLVALGIPDVAAKSLYTCLITDRLDNATFGLSALETLVDDVETELAKVPKSDSNVSWNATALQAIQDEAEDALEGENLDHLIKDAVDTNLQTTVADNSVEGYMLSKANVSNFDRSTDSLEALGEVIASITADSQIRRIAAGSKVIDSAATKNLTIDSGTNGVEILGITINGVIGYKWTVDEYIPTADAVVAPAAADKRSANTYLDTDTEGGQLAGKGVPYNMFLNFTNDGVGSQTITDVVIMYRSRAAITATWEV